MLTAAVGLRWVVALRNPIIFDDGPAFIDIARAMARSDFGSALAHPYHPLYSILIWWTPGSAGREELVGVVWSVVAGTAAVAALWWLLRPLFGAAVALTAAAFLAVHPYAVRFSADVQSDQVHLLFFLLASGFLVRALSRKQVAGAFAAGAATGLAYLTRPEAVGVLVVGAGLAVGGLFREQWSWRRTTAFLAALAAGFMLLASPYMFALWWLSGTLQLTQKKSVFGLIGLSPGTASSFDFMVLLGVVTLAAGLAWALRVRLREWLDTLRSRRISVPELAASGFSVVVIASLMSPLQVVELLASFAATLRPELVFLLVIGVIACARRPGAPSGRAFFFIGFVAVYSVVLFGLLHSAGYVSRRHLLPLSVLLTGYVAIGLHVLARAWASRRVRQGQPVAFEYVVVAILLLFVAIALPKTLRVHRSEQVAARVAAEWVREVAEPGDHIASLRPKAAYYAGLLWVPLREAEGGAREGASIRRLGARWVLAESSDLSPSGEKTLAVAPADGQRFELVYEVERHGKKAYVFEVHEPSSAWSR